MSNDLHMMERHRARIRVLTDRVMRLEKHVEQISQYGIFSEEPPFTAASDDEWRELINSKDKYHKIKRSEIEGD